ncbi:MAG TPA: hypothetical protein VM597_15935 [Gemmataceae bacterium]|jgi:hypothetical protein|nr:hypothetical protein [Gemmataceae bacterium]
MNAESIRRRLQARPFVSFEVRMTNGDVIQIRHPENAWLVGSRLYIHDPTADAESICSLLHIARINMLQAA